MTVRTITYGVHIAFLDDETGQGLAVVPMPEDDLHLPLSVAVEDGTPGGVLTDFLHAAGWDLMVRDLDQRGWEPLADGTTFPSLRDGWTTGARS